MNGGRCRRISIGAVLSLWLICSSVTLAANDFTVVVSIRPVHSLLAGLMQGMSPPLLLIDGQKTPFNFEPDEKDRNLLARASLVFWVGAELERSLVPLIDELPRSKVIELLSSPGMKILPARNNDELRDPYFWMDDRNILIVLDELTQTLVDADPARAHVYTRNRLAMLKPLLRIDRKYEYGYRGVKAGLAVSYFDSLQYFEQAYALKTLGRVVETPWDQIEAARLLQVRGLIDSGQASCLLFDRSMPADNLELLTLNQHIKQGELDVLGGQFEPGIELYLQLMEYNTRVIKNCLKAEMGSGKTIETQAASDDVSIAGGVGGRFLLQDHQGNVFRESDMRGQYSLVFFGYTHCPDICPTSLTVVAQAMRDLGKRAQQIQPIFITVDPERDTVAVMAEYVKYFHPRLVGLTGSDEMIKRVAQQYKVKFEKYSADLSNPEGYAVNHSASLFFMGPDGRFITKFSAGITQDDLVEKIVKIIP